MRILIIEDEAAIADAVAEVLKRNSYLVDVVYDGEDGRDCALSAIYDLIILDIMLPKIDGIEILKEIRKNKISVPIIMLTAKGQTEDKIVGLDSGADDYITKPFHVDELLARIRAIERRPQSLEVQGLHFGDLTFNPHTHELNCQENEVTLSPKEAKVIEVLIRNKTIATSKELLIEKIWGYDSDAVDNNVEIQMYFLRKKLKSLKSTVSIKTIRGSGYLLDSGNNNA
ncbi:response regulator transcription factor [Xylocopilactobacillus apis]|uniref:DNA-binding response regulator n=1 Tax=Xylocopilactobacillus apis TaxID=2932183 RepID=A0AAU9DCR4_9LACO|nr:response regulator transcription factor [Xylocopilactobacillus apis]BDR55936.1 DNA-binding response regulator [Xylocopilactobacillus apis]